MNGKRLDSDSLVNLLRGKRIAELTAASRPLQELVLSETFVIDGILGQSYARSVTPISEMLFGGRSPSYSAGYSSNLVLKVHHKAKGLCGNPVRKLAFNGNFPGLAGNIVSAKIPCYREELVSPFESKKVFYLPREFNAEEEAIELSILSHEGKILRTDRAVGYNLFFPKEKPGTDSE